MSNSSRASSGYSSVFNINQDESYTHRRDSYLWRSGPRRSTAQLEDDLEDIKEAKYRMEKDFDRRVERHKERADMLEKELHHVKHDLMRQERKTMEAEKKIKSVIWKEVSTTSLKLMP
jgi:exonuclease VII large subunit